MEKIELSELDVKILKLANDTMKRKVIQEKLGLTGVGIASRFKKFKELGLTEIQGYGGTFTEVSYEGEPDLYTQVGRHTVLTKLGKETLRRYVNHSVL